MADNNKLLSIVHKKFPALKELDVKVTQGKGKGFAETFISGFDGADADTVEFRDLSNNLTDEQKAGILAGEIISHILPQRNETFQGLVNDFGLSTTDRQLDIGKKFFNRLIDEGGISEEQANRGFPAFFDHVFLPNQVRGLVTPEFNEEAAGTLTTNNLQAGRPILKFLKGK
jgi:hypothetical protein